MKRPLKQKKFNGNYYFLDNQSWWIRPKSHIVHGKVKTISVKKVIAKRKAFWKKRGAKVRVVRYAEGYVIYTRFVK